MLNTMAYIGLTG